MNIPLCSELKNDVCNDRVISEFENNLDKISINFEYQGVVKILCLSVSSYIHHNKMWEKRGSFALAAFCGGTLSQTRRKQ